MVKTVDFKTVLSGYQMVFFDAYGVIRDSKGLVPGIESTFKWLEKHRKEYFIITNDSSRSPELLAAYYHKAGLDFIQPDKIISSGMLAKEFLYLKVKEGIVAYLGTERSAHYIEHPGLEAVPLCELKEQDHSKVSALVLLDDEGFNWFEGLNKAVNLLRRKAIPAILANADGVYPVNRHDVGIAIGGLAWMIEKITGKKIIRFGKPDSQIFMFAWEKVIRNFPNQHKKDIVMVGDTLHTDILGGNKFGFDTVLVLTGNILPEDAETRIMGRGIVPTFICESAAIED